MTAKLKPFNNNSILEYKYGKPHIVFIDGKWRVSKWKRHTGALYYKAHRFVRLLNDRINPVKG